MVESTTRGPIVKIASNATSVDGLRDPSQPAILPSGTGMRAPASVPRCFGWRPEVSGNGRAPPRTPGRGAAIVTSFIGVGQPAFAADFRWPQRGRGRDGGFAAS